MAGEQNPRVLSQKDLKMVMGEGVVDSFDPSLRRAFDYADQSVPQEIKKKEVMQFQPDKLKVSGDGVFYTLQGEGPTMGEPATFLRLHVCNLACGWCDASYTWNPKQKEFWTESKDWSIDETAEKVEASWGSKNPRKPKRLVITGGEPLLQKGGIDQLMDKMPDWKFEIETNGTIMPSEKQLAEAQFNCSPKLANSANMRKARIKPDVIRALGQANTTFKFVVMQPGELDEIQRDYIDGCGIDSNKVILMPQGVTAEEVHKNAQNVAEYAKERGFRLMGRLQNEIWGAKRGV